MTNIAAARELVARVRAAGVTDFCVCAGSRNSPLLAVLGTAGVRIFSFFDERAAAFFAVGRTKLQGRPCAVVTTSGTAVAELLSATIEAHYSGLPLILITADRPARYRGTGAPQAIEQVGIFGPYAETDLERWGADRPLHLNVEFDEPLIDEAVAGARFPGGTESREPRSVRQLLPGTGIWQPATARPLLLIGGLAARDRDRVREFALALSAPVYAEPLSGLREDPALEPILIRNERMLGRGGFTSVIRIGNVPTLRFWRDLDEKLRDLPLVSYSALPFAGLSRGSLHPIEELPGDVGRVEPDESFFAADREAATWFEQLLDDEPRSELTMLRDFARRIERGARVYLGNSLPIREWDLVAPRDDRGLTLEANRGANGIDGQLSTFFGQCDPARMNVAIVGDLTALYDSNAPWIVPQLDDGLRFRIAIINNGGGRIFSRVASLQPLGADFREKVIENAHGVRFGDWARMWNIVELVHELRPDAEATARVWTRYDELWR
jgi:2-succinyl-5-enolpyruvyl-6-hydroxy-3-cyclohexene-1-carboxylate synthase